MLANVVMGMLAAFGALCAIWVGLGMLLPGSGKTVIYCICRKEQAFALRRRWRWLRDLGLIRGRVVILCDRQRALESIRQELESVGAAGNGDSSGDNRRGDLSEL